MTRIEEAHEYVTALKRRRAKFLVCEKFGLKARDQDAFYKKYHVTIGRLIYMTVLRHARELLLTTQDSIKLIAVQVRIRQHIHLL